MATRERVIFSLNRFEWTDTGWLQVWGGWDGMDRRDLTDPALVVRGANGTQRLVPPPDGVRGGARNWHAIFPWTDDAEAIQGAELELGGDLVVELPAPGSGSGRRRFSRTQLAVRELDREGPDEAEGPQVGRPREADPVSLHVAVVTAREEAAAALEELKVARAAAARAGQDAEGERARRQTEAARFHEALDTLRRLAEEGLEKERTVSQQLSAQLDAAEFAVRDERAVAAGLRSQLQSMNGELIEGREIVEAAQAESEALRGRVKELETEAAADAERLRAHLAKAERGAHQASGEVERLRAQLREMQLQVEQSGRAADALRVQSEKAKRQTEQASAESERLRSRLEQTHQQSLESAAQAERLQAQLAAIQPRAEEADRLQAELEGAQTGTREAQSEAERLRRSLAAVREVLQHDA